MKKTFIIFFLLVTYVSLNQAKSITPVFKETSINILKEICIDVSAENINTNNIDRILKNIDIISIYPYFNSIQKKRLENELDFIKYDNKFMINYKKLLSKLDDNNWYRYLYLGVKIEKMKINISENKLEALFSKHSYFKVCNS